MPGSAAGGVGPAAGAASIMFSVISRLVFPCGHQAGEQPDRENDIAFNTARGKSTGITAMDG